MQGDKKEKKKSKAKKRKAIDSVEDDNDDGKKLFISNDVIYQKFLKIFL